MGRTRFAFLAATLFVAGPALVHAQNAYTSRPANVRAGPDRTYPLVAQLAPGTPVDVDGCLSDWSWCDVGFDDTHGWVYAPSLAYDYQGSRVPLYAYAPSFGLPVITFSLGSYWDHYYRGRPWFAQRDQWAGRRIPHHAPPGPPPRRGPPPRSAGGFRPEPGRPEPGRPSSGYRSHAGSAVPERAAPERGSPGQATPERGSRENSAHANTGREVTPHRQAPQQRGAPPSRGEQHGEQSHGGGHPQSGHGDNRKDEGRGEPPH